MGAGFLELPGVASGEDGGAGGSAARGGAEGLGEVDAGACNFIKRRGFHATLAKGTDVGPRLVVGDGEKEVQGVAGGWGAGRKCW